MKITINHKILSIPPYVSVAWKNIASLHAEHRLAQTVLIINLANGTVIEIPNLDGTTLETIFSSHAKYMELESTPPPSTFKKFAFPLPPDFSLPTEIAGIENITGALQHNPEQADTPDLPEDFLSKIQEITKVIPVDENLVPKAEPHCNCIHCQISRAIYKGMEGEEGDGSEEVSMADLTFRTWDILQSGDKLYTVKNPLDDKEHYNVFLGDPIGCTCGCKNCEHIQAVLKS